MAQVLDMVWPRGEIDKWHSAHRQRISVSSSMSHQVDAPQSTRAYILERANRRLCQQGGDEAGWLQWVPAVKAQRRCPVNYPAQPSTIVVCAEALCTLKSVIEGELPPVLAVLVTGYFALTPEQWMIQHIALITQRLSGAPVVCSLPPSLPGDSCE
jgi:hypothetical protein